MADSFITNLEEYRKLVADLNIMLDRVKNFEFKFSIPTIPVEPCSGQLNQEVS